MRTSTQLLRALRTRPVTPSTSTRAFSISPSLAKNKDGSLSTSSHVNTSNLPDDKHTMDKANDNDTYDVQTSGVKDAMNSAKKNNTGGAATEDRDSQDTVAKTKRENPEAPDPAIGMQDERGGRGA
ncbi:hypothetical protein M011DRAFT_331471 [Sporormia fimetaria CBS 119925]|uniref:Uncharacterized protein n=1 Tax=Sporormia fimetaria CBS 119925 TaxID=1340428 RepID=A0A6A6VFN3_9PLEO|nr:hypothetical protein M011DRAFT_331471 [Sporormia fimetaria CBS 119925]